MRVENVENSRYRGIALNFVVFAIIRDLLKILNIFRLIN